MKGDQRVFQVGEYKTLPLRFIVGRATETIPAFGKGRIQPEHVEPNYDPPPYEYSAIWLERANTDPSIASCILQSWTDHNAKLGYYLQFSDDPTGEKLKRFHSHTELASAILGRRLNMDSAPLWEMFEWILQFKFLQEDYRADTEREARYDHHLKQLEKVDKLHPDRQKSFRILERAGRQIQLDASQWNRLPEAGPLESNESDRAIKLFYSYSHKDEALRDELQKHLSIIQRSGLIEQWHDRRISTGQEWKGEIDEHLKSADIILLLISSDFLSSDYCYDVELELAIRRHESGDARIIPVFLRPCDWDGGRFGRFQGTPTDAKPVTTWENQDEAFTDIARHIRTAATEIQVQRSAE